MTLHAGRWVGVDLDGTLAHYEQFEGPAIIGKPIPAMVNRVKSWLMAGLEVRIVTARVCPEQDLADRDAAFAAIGEWCREHIGQVLPVQAHKDYRMIELWDDRVRRVEPNTGIEIGGSVAENLDGDDANPWLEMFDEGAGDGE